MARAIDKRIMLDLITEAKKTDPEAGPFSEWLAEYLVDHLPTLTPQNEPLTIEQLREMDGEPVWVESIQEQQTQPEGWCVIGIFGRGRFLCALIPGDEDTPWELDTYGKCWLAYRRPPEGEEDT